MTVGPLPLGIDPSSLQTKVETGSIVVQGLELRRRSGGALEEGERAELSARLAALRVDRRAMESKIKGVNAGIGALQEMMKGLGSGAAEQEVIMSQEKRLRFFIEEAEKLDGDLAELERAIVAVDDQIRDLSGQLEPQRDRCLLIPPARIQHSSAGLRKGHSCHILGPPLLSQPHEERGDPRSKAPF